MSFVVWDSYVGWFWDTYVGQIKTDVTRFSLKTFTSYVGKRSKMDRLIPLKIQRDKSKKPRHVLEARFPYAFILPP